MLECFEGLYEVIVVPMGPLKENYMRGSGEPLSMCGPLHTWYFCVCATLEWLCTGTRQLSKTATSVPSLGSSTSDTQSLGMWTKRPHECRTPHQNFNLWIRVEFSTYYSQLHEYTSIGKLAFFTWTYLSPGLKIHPDLIFAWT